MGSPVYPHISWRRKQALLLNCSEHKRLQKVMILYRLMLRNGIFIRGEKPCEFSLLALENIGLYWRSNDNGKR